MATRAQRAQATKKEKENNLRAIAKSHNLEDMSAQDLESVIAAATQVAKERTKKERISDLSYVRHMCRKHKLTAAKLKGYLVATKPRKPKDMYAYFVEWLQRSLNDDERAKLKLAIATVEQEKAKKSKTA
jgi:hypothetical protein